MIEPALIRCPHVHVVELPSCATGELDELVLALEGDELSTERREFPRGTWLGDGRLDLCKQALGKDGGKRVATGFLGDRKVKALLLGTNGLGNEGISRVAEAASEHPSLETLYLGCNGIGAGGAESLRAALQRNPRIRSLWLKRNPLGDDGVAAIADLVRESQTLEVLDLVNCGLEAKGLRCLVEALAMNRSLSALYLGGNGLLPAAGALLAEALNEHSTLRHLYLDANRLEDIGAEALSEGRWETLSLASNGIGASGVAALARKLPTRSLSLDHSASAAVLGAEENCVGDEGLHRLGDALMSSPLRELRLGRTECSPAVMDRFLTSVQDSSLEQLSISGHGLPPWTKARIREVIGELRESLNPPHLFDIRSVYR